MKKIVLFLFVFATSTLCTLANVEKELQSGMNIYVGGGTAALGSAFACIR